MRDDRPFDDRALERLVVVAPTPDVVLGRDLEKIEDRLPRKQLVDEVPTQPETDAGYARWSMVLVARHQGMRILAISTVTDMATGLPGLVQHVTHEEVLAVADRAGKRLANVVKGVVRRL